MSCTSNPGHWAMLIVVLVTCIALCGCTSSGPPSKTTQTLVPGVTTINIQNFAFIPASITIPKGTTVTWVNQDTTDHQITNDAQGSIGQGAISTSNSLPKGAQYSFRFDTPGTYPYHCGIHPSMKGTITVT